MKQSIEMERIIYALGKQEHSTEENLFLLVKEQEGEVIQWKPIAKGWEYSLWHSIGERGGLAEAEELLVMQEDKVATMKIEDYVALYQKELTRPTPAEQALERFSIELRATMKKSCENKYAKKAIHEDYNMELTDEDEGSYYYKKTVETVADFSNVAFDYDGVEHSFSLLFLEKQNKIREEAVS